MPGGAIRREMRTRVRDALAVLPRMAAIPDRKMLSQRPEVGDLPERMVGTPTQDPVQQSRSGIDRRTQLDVIVRRTGEDAFDELDLDQDEIEPAVMAALEIENTTCTPARVEFVSDGGVSPPIAQMTLSFTVVDYD